MQHEEKKYMVVQKGRWERTVVHPPGSSYLLGLGAVSSTTRASVTLTCNSQIGERHWRVECGVTYGGGKSACTDSGCAWGFCGGKCTTRGAFCGAAPTGLHIGMCARGESAAEDEAKVVESIDMVRARASTGVCGCAGTGSVAAECAEDVEGWRKITLERCLRQGLLALEGRCTCIYMFSGDKYASANPGNLNLLKKGVTEGKSTRVIRRQAARQ
jgi:hypothetical protein